MKKMKISQFIGRQLSRLKMGQSYYNIVMMTITAVSLMSIAFRITVWILFFLFPILLFGTYVIGYLMDVWNINSMDQIKTIEMTHRYVNTSDLKSFDFWIVLMTTMFKWMESIQKGEPIDLNILNDEFIKYLKKWNPPKDEKS